MLMMMMDALLEGRSMDDTVSQWHNVPVLQRYSDIAEGIAYLYVANGVSISDWSNSFCASV